MKTIAPLLFAALCVSAGAVHAADQSTYVYTCKSKRDCPKPPVPPAPPAPPMAEMPPVPAVPAAGMYGPPVMPAPPAPPAAPAPPAPPAPPPPLRMPDVPKAAHAACATKAAGSSLTFTVGKGKVMAGYCERENGKMVFHLEAYHSES
jgi:hypothetical protein